jgi:ADP-heptose:LPS heptosyltransferase
MIAPKGASALCVIHLNQIGDLVFSLPLLKALRDTFPAARIHSVVKPHLKGLLADSPYVDCILERPNRFGAVAGLVSTMRNSRYDLLISLPRSEESLIIAALSGARLKAGFSHLPWDLALNVKETVEGHNSWYNNRKLLHRLQVPVTKDNYVGLIRVDPRDGDRTPPKGRYAIIAPGASRRRQMKTWGYEQFAALAAQLGKSRGLAPVIIGGDDNREYNDLLIAALRETGAGAADRMVDLTGADLRSLCLAIKDAALFVGIDSGFMHLASSYDIPVVALFGPTDPLYVGPQNRRSRVVRAEGMECIPCYLKECDHRACMKNIRLEAVVQACEEVLELER